MSATSERTLFRLGVQVARDIDASPEVVWGLLTDAEAQVRWNSTVESLQGPIERGQRLAIRVPVAPGRVFSPTVVELDAPRHMVWQDGFAPMFRGTRTFTLTPLPGERTRFEMQEVFTGLMLPLIAGSLPDFVPVFDRYAADLAAAAEGQGR